MSLTPNAAEMQRRRGRPPKRIKAETARPRVENPDPVEHIPPAPPQVKEVPADKIWVQLKNGYFPPAGVNFIRPKPEVSLGDPEPPEPQMETFPDFPPEAAAERNRMKLKPGTRVFLSLREASRLINANKAFMIVPGM